LKAEISKTLAHPLRLAILHNLKSGEKTVNQLTQTIGDSQCNISQHLSILRQRQIVKTRKNGTNIYCRVASPKISQAQSIPKISIIAVIVAIVNRYSRVSITE
jgi:ArsR family transcriptional regulator, virulence genes transcriptional regulator